MMEELEFVSWFVVGLLAAFAVLVSFLYWLEAKRDMEEIDHSVKKCRRMVSEAESKIQTEIDYNRESV